MGSLTSSRKAFNSVIVEPEPLGTLRRYVGQVHRKTVLYTFSRPLPIDEVVAFHESYRRCLTPRHRLQLAADLLDRQMCIVLVEPLAGSAQKAA